MRYTDLIKLLRELCGWELPGDYSLTTKWNCGVSLTRYLDDYTLVVYGKEFKPDDLTAEIVEDEIGLPIIAEGVAALGDEDAMNSFADRMKGLL